jgi:AraC family transcriptional regulator, transcriptional activator of pobA
MKHHEYFPLLKHEDLDVSLPFNILSFKKASDEKPANSSHPHKQNYIEILWTTKGSGSLVLDMEKHTLRSNSIFCITPGQLHHFKPDEDAEGYIITFTEAFLHMGDHEYDLTYNAGLFQSFSKSAGIHIDTDIARELNEIAVKMARECRHVYLFKAEILRRYLKIFLIYLTRQFQGPMQTIMQNRNLELVERFKSLVEVNFKVHRKVSDYASLLAVTPNYLNEIVKKTTGYPASYHIRQRIVLEAKRRAMYPDVCMKEVAWYLGFSDIAHFSKFFKNITGTTFSDFKRECLVVSGVDR